MKTYEVNVKYECDTSILIDAESPELAEEIVMRDKDYSNLHIIQKYFGEMERNLSLVMRDVSKVKEVA
jgi:hypothetical protein